MIDFVNDQLHQRSIDKRDRHGWHAQSHAACPMLRRSHKSRKSNLTNPSCLPTIPAVPKGVPPKQTTAHIKQPGRTSIAARSQLFCLSRSGLRIDSLQCTRFITVYAIRYSVRGILRYFFVCGISFRTVPLLPLTLFPEFIPGFVPKSC